jgi:hypothetical protein
MGKIRQNKAQIVPGALISASYVADLYDLLTSNTIEDTAFTGSVSISGSLSVITGSIHGTLIGTSSWAVSASRAVTASNAVTASHAAFAMHAAYAPNMGVTRIIPGHNISISPGPGTGSVTIHSNDCCGSSFPFPTSSFDVVYGRTIDMMVGGQLSVSGGLFVNPLALPTSDPGVYGQVWRSGNFLVISLG